MTTSSTVMRAFTGMLEVGEETVPATVRFSDGSVTLLVADDEVGRWPSGEIRFVDADDAYDLLAEGDSIRFLPDERSQFGSYLSDAASPSQGDPPSPRPGDVPPVVVDEPAPLAGAAPEPAPAEEEEGDRGGGGGEWVAPSPVDDAPGLLPSDPEEGSRRGLLEEEEAQATQDEPEDSRLSLEAADEEYAAGLSAPAPDLPRPTFRSALTEPDAPVTTPSSPPLETRQEAPPAPREEAAGRHDDATPEVSYEEPTSLPPPPSDPSDGGSPSDDEEGASSGRSSLGAMLSRLRPRQAAGPTEVETTREAGEEPDDDLPTPLSDSDNLKQWALVVAGGLVLLAIMGVVVWGVVSMLGGDDPRALASESEPVATTVPAPAQPAPTTSPTTAPPLTTVPLENREAAQAFVASWNEIARDYAYHLTISADSLPVSTAPAPTVHLTYGEDGILELMMAPKGSGADRDILVAMGLAVAWADPSLTPEGRKQLLGAMGVAVDDPRVGDMGGELDRNGVRYSTSVTDGVIRFLVDPPA